MNKANLDIQSWGALNSTMSSCPVNKAISAKQFMWLEVEVQMSCEIQLKTKRISSAV